MTEKSVMSVQELAQQMGISLPKAYELVKEPGFPTIRIGEYFLEHAKAAYSLMGADLVNKQGEYLLSKIQKEQVREFSRRDAMRMCRNFKTADSIQIINGLLPTVLRTAVNNPWTLPRA